MTKKQSNVIKFTLCTLATVGLLWVFSIDDWSYFHVGVFAACVGVWLWYSQARIHRQ